MNLQVRNWEILFINMSGYVALTTFPFVQDLFQIISSVQLFRDLVTMTASALFYFGDTNGVHYCILIIYGYQVSYAGL